MPFLKVNIREEINKMKQENKEFESAYESIDREYELVEKAIKNS